MTAVWSTAYLNTAMMHFGNNEVVPVYYTTFTLSSVAGGAIVYCHEVPLYTPVFEAMEAGDRARAEVRPRPLAPPPFQTLRLTRRPGPADTA